MKKPGTAAGLDNGRMDSEQDGALEVRGQQPDPMAMVEYEIVSMGGVLLLSFFAPLGYAILWEPEPGFEIRGPCAGRYRVAPDGPWIVRAYYPEGFPGPQGPWPDGTELPAQRAALTG
jgi:hypothetical protein